MGWVVLTAARDAAKLSGVAHIARWCPRLRKRIRIRFWLAGRPRALIAAMSASWYRAAPNTSSEPALGVSRGNFHSNLSTQITLRCKVKP